MIGILLVLAAAEHLGAAPASAQDVFRAARAYPETESGKLRALADADLDGDADAIEITGFPQSSWTGFEVHLSDGARQLVPGAAADFPEPPTSLVFFARHPPSVGDVTGDGLDDLVVERYSNQPAGGGNPGFYVYRGDGSGGFVGPDLVQIPSAPGRFDLGQIDGDAALEIVARYSGIGQTPELRWFHWTPAGGTASAPLSLTAPADPDGGLHIARAIDLDGDGDSDAYGLSSDFQRIRTFPTVSGAPTYGPSVPLPAGYQDINVEIRAHDLDADGDVELLALREINTFGAPKVAVLVFEGTPGGFVQRPEIVVDLFGQVYFSNNDVFFGDLDEDGDDEVIGVGYHAIALSNDGGLSLSYGSAGLLVGQTGEAGIGDVDADGHLDAVGENSVLYGSGAFEDVQVAPTTFQPAAIPAPVILDWEDDGDVDLAGSPAALVYGNDGTGALSAIATTGNLGPGLGPFVSFGDFTGDGRGDWIARKSDLSVPFFPQFIGMVLLADDGFGELVEGGLVAPPSVPISVPLGEQRIPAGDVEMDGDLDLLAEDGFWPNDGTPFFPFIVPSWSGVVLAHGDLEGDGDTDLVTDGTGSQLVLWRRVGAQLQSQLLLSGLADPAAQLLDLDLDGFLEIAGGDSGAEPLRVYELAGGTAVLSAALGVAATRTPAIAAADEDGDGLVDLFATRTSNVALPATSASVLRGTGPDYSYGIPEHYVVAGGVHLYADLDGDSDLDALGTGLSDGTRHVEPASGSMRQYGAGATLSGVVAPVLGAKGPLWAGAQGAELRLRFGPGGGIAYLVLGLTEANLPSTPVPGLTLYVGGPAIVGPLLLSGAPGAIGQGELDVPLPTDGFLAGLEVFLEIYTLDPADPSGKGHTNGLELVFGS